MPILEKLRVKTELLNYEIIDNKTSTSMIKEIKLYLINQIKKYIKCKIINN